MKLKYPKASKKETSQRDHDAVTRRENVPNSFDLNRVAPPILSYVLSKIFDLTASRQRVGRLPRKGGGTIVPIFI